MTRARRWFAAALALLAVPCGTVCSAGPIEVRGTPILHFEPRDPDRTRFGGLVYRGGVVLSSDDGAFGGFSGLWLDPDGSTLVAITDRGDWLTGRIVYDGDRPAGLADAAIAPVLGPTGKPLKSTREGDDESLSVKDGVAVVGIEQVHRLMRFDFGGRHPAETLPDTRGSSVAVPEAVRKALFAAGGNEGFEAVALLDSEPGGRMLGFGEHSLDPSGNLRAWIIDDGKAEAFAVQALPGDFSITDVAQTAGGRLLLLERYFSYARGLFVRIRSLSLADIVAGAVVDGPVLLEGSYDQEIDNLEGIAVSTAADGASVVTLISDDNFSPLQRTLLLQFTMP